MREFCDREDNRNPLQELFMNASRLAASIIALCHTNAQTGAISQEKADQINASLQAVIDAQATTNQRLDTDEARQSQDEAAIAAGAAAGSDNANHLATVEEGINALTDALADAAGIDAVQPQPVPAPADTSGSASSADAGSSDTSGLSTGDHAPSTDTTSADSSSASTTSGDSSVDQSVGDSGAAAEASVSGDAASSDTSGSADTSGAPALDPVPASDSPSGAIGEAQPLPSDEGSTDTGGDAPA